MANYYSFTSFLRKGISNSIRNIDDLSKNNSGNSSQLARPTIDATVYVKFDSDSPDPVKKTLEVFSPANVTGIDKRAIIRTDPEHYCTNYEPNYLPAIEFFEEDFPWRFSPTSINELTLNPLLTPWLSLVVLEESEFEDMNISINPGGSGQGLPYFRLQAGVSAADIFPPFNELHLWAHVHVNTDITTGSNALKNALDEEGDACYSRIICPRRLKAKSKYHAFLIPSYETGRLAGLGNFNVAETTPVNQSAWDAGQTDFPYYHRWYFATGAMGDFEYLARQLTPKPANDSVGYRPIEVDGIAEPLQLPGCLRVPLGTLDPLRKKEIEDYEKWAGNRPHPWQKKTASEISVITGSEDDPVVARPLYGRWHAVVEEELYKESGNNLTLNNAIPAWVAELNLDPRYRAIAAMGVSAIQKNQEKLMDAAWDQVDEIRKANEKIRLAQLAIQVNKRFQEKILGRFNQEQLINFTVPLHNRLSAYPGKDSSIKFTLEGSVVPDKMVSNLFRKVSRMSNRIFKIGNVDNTMFSKETQLLHTMNAGTLASLQDKPVPTGFLSELAFRSIIENYITKQPAFTNSNLADKNKLLQSVKAAMQYSVKFQDQLNLPGTVFHYQKIDPVFDRQLMTPGSSLPVRPIVNRPSSRRGRVVSRPGNNSVNTPSTSISRRTDISTLPSKAVFAASIQNAATVFDFNKEIVEEPKTRLNLNQLSDHLIESLDAVSLFGKMYAHQFPNLFSDFQPSEEWFEPAMAYPVFDIPAYKFLNQKSPELFLPNINRIQNNSVTLLETNQQFIESYMVGLNYEFARELLWRDFPTDQRGSYFRMFWDSLEPRFDIDEIHTWERRLGINNADRVDNYLVLIVRGDLLKKFPRTIIGVQKAKWADNSVTKDRSIDNSAEFTLPEFEAVVSPDIFFLGFNLKEEKLVGKRNATSTSDDPGYFFVFKEIPGEPRFGLDESKGTSPLKGWNDLSWAHVQTDSNKILKMTNAPSLQFTKTGDDQQAQFPALNSSQLAYILYQQPALIGIHASRLLP